MHYMNVEKIVLPTINTNKKIFIVPPSHLYQVDDSLNVKLNNVAITPNMQENCTTRISIIEGCGIPTTAFIVLGRLKTR